jgi:hypothetical protein
MPLPISYEVLDAFARVNPVTYAREPRKPWELRAIRKQRSLRGKRWLERVQRHLARGASQGDYIAWGVVRFLLQDWQVYAK